MISEFQLEISHCLRGPDTRRKGIPNPTNCKSKGFLTGRRLCVKWKKSSRMVVVDGFCRMNAGECCACELPIKAETSASDNFLPLHLTLVPRPRPVFNPKQAGGRFCPLLVFPK